MTNSCHNISLFYKLIGHLAMVLLLIACNKSRGPKIPELRVNVDELTHDTRGVYYYQDSVFSGFAIDLSDSKVLKSVASYFNGKLEGDLVGFYPNGDTAYIRPYHLGEKHGDHLGYYRNGERKFHYYYENGFSQGNHKFWYMNGNLKEDLNYVDGKEFGSQRVWRPDGKLRSNYVVRENGRKYGILGLKRCSKIDSNTENIDPYKGQLNQ